MPTMPDCSEPAACQRQGPATSRRASSLNRPPILVGASLGGIAAILAAGEEPMVSISALALVDVAAYMRA